MRPARRRPRGRDEGCGRAGTTARVDPRRMRSSGSGRRVANIHSRRDRAADAGLTLRPPHSSPPRAAPVGKRNLTGVRAPANGADGVHDGVAGHSPAGRGGAGDDGGDSSRGDGKGSHDYWFCVRSKMARRIAPGLLLVYRWNLDSHGMLRPDWPNCRGLSAAERTKS